ncbi:MAG: hypothetical protein PHP25_04155 [Candidatus Moranbacteria bacterium]|nr:hypothetical protein [Candidatus Moranbacteria bacterium]
MDGKALKKLYANNSSANIAKIFDCSESKINYWLKKYKISKRSISEAMYLKNNPGGDPFKLKFPRNIADAQLFGLGVGLYWGEGNKANKNTVRLGSSDAELLKIFINFLIKFFGIKRRDLKFHLHIFSDIKTKKAKKYWMRELSIKEKQIYKPFVSISGSIGTYRKKSEYGVMTVYYGNTKLRNKLVHLIEQQKNNKPL